MLKLLNNYYDVREDYKKNFNMLCLGLLFYLKRLYDNSGVLDESGTYTLDKRYEKVNVRRKLISNVRSMYRIVGVKGDDISLKANDISFDEGKYGIDLLKKIFE